MKRAPKMRGVFCERTATPAATFDRRSFRWVRRGKTWLLIGCPKGRWKRNRCAVGTRAHKILTPRRGTTCPRTTSTTFKDGAAQRVNLRELEVGSRIEREHIGARTPREIALQHLREDPRYYSKLCKWHADTACALFKRR